MVPYPQLRPSFHLSNVLAHVAAVAVRWARTDGDLHLRWPAGRGSKGPGAIVACRHRRSLQRANQLLPKHRVAGAMGYGGLLAELKTMMF